MIKKITSTSNPLIKEILQLGEKARYRRSESAFIVEGRKEIQMAVNGGYKVKKVIYNPELMHPDSIKLLLGNMHLDEVVEVNDHVYQKIAYRDNTEGLIAIFETKDLGIDNLNLSSQNPLVLVAVSPEKPGNIGALLRTAEAAGVDAFIVADPLTDMFNPNIIRSSLGTLFTCNIAAASSEEVMDFLKNRQISIKCAAIVPNSVNCYHENYSHPSAIVVGPEADGLNKYWLENANSCIQIPMHGQADSLNVSVSAAILVFEAVRQRKYN